MTAAWNRQQTSIGHVTLRYRGAGTDGNLPALRLRTERMLGSMDLQPPGLPPGALLIVRTLRSLPEFAPLSTSSQPQSAWVDHLRTQMATLYRTAVRPALSAVSPAATSVLFADAAEMLICLTRDVLNGRVRQQWYWQQMLRHVPPTPGSALTAIWSEQAAFVPAMLVSLKTDEVRAAIALLTVQEVSQIIGALNASFDLPSPRHIPVLTPTTALPLNPSLTVLSPEGPRVEQIAEQYASVLPPWQRWLSASTLKPLTPQSHYLLGLIVTMYYAPTFARSTTFIAQAVSWLDTELRRASSSVETIENAPILAQQPHDSSQTEMMESNVLTPLGRARSPHNDHSPGTANDTSNDVLFGAAQSFPTDGLLTGLGGIFYLIHLLKWLDLPAIWAESAMLVEHLGSWGTVELLARGLLGDLYHRYANDPIWNVLAMLDKREPDTLIGAELPAQTVFRLPAKWLLRYGIPHPSWIAATGGSRLYLVDEDAGYLIVDVPLGERSLDEAIDVEVGEYRVKGIQASGHKGQYISNKKNGYTVGAQFIAPWGETSAPQAGAIHCAPTSISRYSNGIGHKGHHSFALDCPDMPIHPHALWWLERVIGFVYYLLIRALNESAIDAHSLPATLLCKGGCLVAGRTHIDLYMSMEQISLSIRRAGLDCDPSWVPDLGRIVLFHFGQER